MPNQQQPTQQQLSLPYVEIKEVVGRSYLRDNYTVSSRVCYKIPVKDIKVREGFNKRIVYEGIEELAASIKEKTVDGLAGLETPLTVDIVPCGDCFVEKGHRRLKAILLLIEQGEKIEFVECLPNSKSKTELERMEDIYNSNMYSMKLKPMEQAAVVFDLKNNFGKVSNEEIAQRLNISRQKVDYLLLLASADDATKQEILNGDMNLTDAVAFIRKQKKLDKQTDEAEMDSHKTSAAPTQVPKDELAGDIKELNELEKQEAPEKEEELTEEEIEKREEQRKIKEAKELEALLAISDEIKINKLDKHIGRKLSNRVLRSWTEDFVDEDTSEVVTIERNELLYPAGEAITEEMVEALKLENLQTVLVYKKGMEPVAKSVITVAPGEEEKGKYDLSRDEMKQIANCIGLADKIEAVVNKLDVPEGTKKDIASYVQWLQKDLAEVREWCHKNKKQNKLR